MTNLNLVSRTARFGGAVHARSADRHSATVVRLTLPVGAILKSTRGTVERVDADGETDLERVGNMRRGDGWVFVVRDEQGNEFEI